MSTIILFWLTAYHGPFHLLFNVGFCCLNNCSRSYVNVVFICSLSLVLTSVDYWRWLFLVSAIVFCCRSFHSVFLDLFVVVIFMSRI